MSLFVLVHGAWHHGGLLAPVVRHLESCGHQALAPTLAGHGKGAQRGVSHDECLQSLVDYLGVHDLRDVILVGHSFAGTVIARAAPVVRQRLRRLVFWNAFVPADGECLTDLVPPHYRELFYQIAAQSPDHTVTLPFPIWRETFINDADLATARAAYEQLSPEPYGLFTTALPMRPFEELIRAGAIGCSYINCTEDISLPQSAEWGWHPRLSSRLGLFRLVQMRGSHEVLFTNPAGIAQAIIAAGRD